MIELINLIYVLIEKNFLLQKVVANNIKNFFKKNNALLSLEELMIKIREIYSRIKSFNKSLILSKSIIAKYQSILKKSIN